MIAYKWDDKDLTADDYKEFVLYFLGIEEPEPEEQQVQICLLRLTKKSPEIFRGWMYKPIPRLFNCCGARLWLVANRIIGSTWRIDSSNLPARPKVTISGDDNSGSIQTSGGCYANQTSKKKVAKAYSPLDVLKIKNQRYHIFVALKLCPIMYEGKRGESSVINNWHELIKIASIAHKEFLVFPFPRPNRTTKRLSVYTSKNAIAKKMSTLLKISTIYRNLSSQDHGYQSITCLG